MSLPGLFLLEPCGVPIEFPSSRSVSGHGDNGWSTSHRSLFFFCSGLGSVSRFTRKLLVPAPHTAISKQDRGTPWQWWPAWNACSGAVGRGRARRGRQGQRWFRRVVWGRRQDGCMGAGRAILLPCGERASPGFYQRGTRSACPASIQAGTPPAHVMGGGGAIREGLGPGAGKLDPTGNVRKGPDSLSPRATSLPVVRRSGRRCDLGAHESVVARESVCSSRTASKGKEGGDGTVGAAPTLPRRVRSTSGEAHLASICRSQRWPHPRRQVGSQSDELRGLLAVGTRLYSPIAHSWGAGRMDGGIVWEDGTRARLLRGGYLLGNG